MTQAAAPAPFATARRLPWRTIAVGLALVVAVAAAWTLHLRRLELEARLLTVTADRAGADPALVRFAVAEAKPLFARYCAACHGADMKGNPAIGAPNLTDAVWLYGVGDVFGIERTLLYGVRSGLKRGHDVTEMPAFGLRGQLTPAQIGDVVQYILALNRRPHDEQAAELGRTVFTGPSACADCHGSDARGNPDYGAPDLTDNVWDWGGSPQALYDSIYFGRHGMMPAQIDRLSLEQIRALAVYVHAVSHR